MLRTLGADVVGMSMALETIAAREAGAEVLGLAAGDQPGRLDGDRRRRGAALAAVGVLRPPAVAAIVRHVVGSLP